MAEDRSEPRTLACRKREGEGGGGSSLVRSESRSARVHRSKYRVHRSLT